MKIKSFVFSYVTNLKTYTTCPDLSGEKNRDSTEVRRDLIS